MYTTAGIASKGGVIVYRFTNQPRLSAAKAQLKFGGFDNINIMQLPFAMLKDDAIAYLNARGIVADATNLRGDGESTVDAAAETAARELLEAVAEQDKEWLEKVCGVAGSTTTVTETVEDAPVVSDADFIAGFARNVEDTVAE
jgi:hypothetical protein